MSFYNCNGIAYTVKRGDTLYGIIRRYNVPLAAVVGVNPMLDIYNLKPGTQICIPMLFEEGVEIGPVFPVQQDVKGEDYDSILAQDTELEYETDYDYAEEEEDMQAEGFAYDGYENEAYETLNNSYNNYSRLKFDNDEETEPKYVIVSYVVKNDDSLQSLFERFGIGYNDLIQLNDLNDVMLRPGMLINVPNKKAMDDQKYENN